MLSFVPEEIERYCETHTSPEPPVFAALAKETRAKTDMPQMQVGHVQGTFLKCLVRATGARKVVEIGTFTGYSSLMMAEGLPDDGELITLDIDPQATAIARAHWDRSPHGNKITLKLGRAADSLKEIDEPIDFVFIDADKQSYIGYWDAVVPKVKSGGLIVVDNVLWSGDVLDPKDDEARALVAFNRHVLEDDRVEHAMLTIRDGVTVACKR